jgi:hypothetical protein
MEIEESLIRQTLKRILTVEREHLFGLKTGSQSARKKELERELDRELSELVKQMESQRSQHKRGVL